MSDPVIDGRTRRAVAKREARREAILRAAATVFSRRGYERATITDVIREVGITRATFYLYFENKGAILLELAEELFEALKSTVSRTAEPAETSPEALALQLRAVLGVIAENRTVTALLLRRKRGADEALDARVEEFFANLRGLLVYAIDVRQRDGIVRPVDSALAVDCFLAAALEAIDATVLDGEVDGAELDRLSASLAELSLRGLLPVESAEHAGD